VALSSRFPSVRPARRHADRPVGHRARGDSVRGLARGALTGQIHVIAADLGDPEQRAAATAEVVGTVRVDILVNNAATIEPLGPTAAELRHAFEVNVIAPIALTVAVLPGMLDAGRSRIVNVSSAIVASPGSMVRGNAGSPAASPTAR
jgi:short-subunit dehydrogenase